MEEKVSCFLRTDKKHRPIHEEALLHYFDPSKKGQKFESQQKVNIPTESDIRSTNQADEATKSRKDEVTRKNPS